MLIFLKGFHEYIHHIFIPVKVGVVNYLAFMQISTVVIANVDVLSSSFDAFRGNQSQITLIVAVDWEQW
jgi:hypothetical protein